MLSGLVLHYWDEFYGIVISFMLLLGLSLWYQDKFNVNRISFTVL